MAVRRDEPEPLVAGDASRVGDVLPRLNAWDHSAADTCRAWSWCTCAKARRSPSWPERESNTCRSWRSSL